MEESIIASLILLVVSLFIVFIVGTVENILISFSVMIIHEMSHLVVAKLLGYRIEIMKVLAYGASLHVKDIDQASCKEDLLISLAGPMVNFMLAGLGFVATNLLSNEYINIFIQYNLLFGAFNLIPIRPFDGSRVLGAILNQRCGIKVSKIISDITSGIIIMSFMIIYLVSFIRGEDNIIFGILIIALILNMQSKRMEDSFLIMEDLVKKRYRFLKKGYLENYGVSIIESKGLLESLKVIEKRRYNIITILDDELKFLGEIYEYDILDGLKEYGNITLGELLKLKRMKGE